MGCQASLLYSNRASKSCNRILKVWPIYITVLFRFSFIILFLAIGLSQSGAFTTWVPYDLIRPVLERATAVQLYQIEDNNVYLLDDTDELWKVLCQKEHKKAVRQELETWRELYLVIIKLFCLFFSVCCNITKLNRGATKSVSHVSSHLPTVTKSLWRRRYPFAPRSSHTSTVSLEPEVWAQRLDR